MHDNNLNLIQKTMASAEYIANVMAGLEQVGAAIKAREQASSGRTSSRGELQVLQAAIQTGAVSPVRPSPSKKRKKKMSKAARAKARGLGRLAR